MKTTKNMLFALLLGFFSLGVVSVSAHEHGDEAEKSEECCGKDGECCKKCDKEKCDKEGGECCGKDGECCKKCDKEKCDKEKCDKEGGECDKEKKSDCKKCDKEEKEEVAE